MCVCIQAPSVTLCFTLVSKMQTQCGLIIHTLPDLESPSGFLYARVVGPAVARHRQLNPGTGTATL